ncbi:MAG: hypothetical protein WCY19_05095 [Candidatus Gastranaerophilaceae bacterium]
MKKVYTDKHGEKINYGDILKCDFMEAESKKDFAPKAPFVMLVEYDDNKDMFYISGMDDFVEISEFQRPNSAVNINGMYKLDCLEIFANRCVYENNLNYFNQ